MIPTELFHADELPARVQVDPVTASRRKVPVEPLENCPLRVLLQWKCEPVGEEVRCVPIERIFRM